MDDQKLSEMARQAYERAGWKITANGNADADITTGPCARCQTPHERYGPLGKPLCDRCGTPDDSTPA